MNNLHQKQSSSSGGTCHKSINKLENEYQMRRLANIGKPRCVDDQLRLCQEPRCAAQELVQTHLQLLGVGQEHVGLKLLHTTGVGPK